MERLPARQPQQITAMFNINAGKMNFNYFLLCASIMSMSLIAPCMPLAKEGQAITHAHCAIGPAVNPAVTGKEVIFVSTGKTFAPVLTVKKGTAVLWTFADGTSSSSPAPCKSYAVASNHWNMLRVTPWSGLIRVNIGFDGSDGGSESIEHVAGQGVNAVYNMHLMAPYLRQWCSSYNPINSLKFDDFINLDTIECYKSSLLTSLSLHNTPLLSRMCFESCRLTTLDVSQSPALADLRAAGNKGLAITWGRTSRSVWHICTHDSLPRQNSYANLSRFSNLKDLWIWNNKLSGRLVVKSTHLRSVSAKDNHYDFADFTGCFPNADTKGEIDVSNNQLSHLVICHDPGLLHLDAHNNRLNANDLERILLSLDQSGRHEGFVDLSDNGPLTRNARAYAHHLESKGWIVKVSKDCQPDFFHQRIYHILHKFKKIMHLDDAT